MGLSNKSKLEQVEWMGMVIVKRRFESDNSRKKLQRVRSRLKKFAEVMEQQGYVYKIFITLTFRDEVSDEDARYKFMIWLKEMRRKYKNIKYFWVCERQKRGVLHYHVVVWSNVKLKKPDEEFWRHGMSRIEIVRKNVYTYMLKYLSKETISGRMYGYSQGVITAWVKFPVYLWDVVGKFFLFKRRGYWEIVDLEGRRGVIGGCWYGDGGVEMFYRGDECIFECFFKLFDILDSGVGVVV